MKTNHHLEEESNMNGKIAIVWFDILIGNREKKEGQFKKQICLQDKRKGFGNSIMWTFPIQFHRCHQFENR